MYYVSDWNFTLYKSRFFFEFSWLPIEEITPAHFYIAGIVKKIIYYFKGPGKRGHIVAAHCCRHKCFPVFSRAQHLLRTQILCPGHKKCFWFCSQTFWVRNKCFPVCAAQKTSCVRNNVSETMCPRLPGPQRRNLDIGYKPNCIDPPGWSSSFERLNLWQNDLVKQTFTEWPKFPFIPFIYRMMLINERNWTYFVSTLTSRWVKQTG